MDGGKLQAVLTSNFFVALAYPFPGIIPGYSMTDAQRQIVVLWMVKTVSCPDQEMFLPGQACPLVGLNIS